LGLLATLTLLIPSVFVEAKRDPLLIKIVIHNPNSETVVHNVQPPDLTHWLTLLGDCAKGIIRIYDEDTGFEIVPPSIQATPYARQASLVA
jgi:hypothetical protein